MVSNSYTFNFFFNNMISAKSFISLPPPEDHQNPQGMSLILHLHPFTTLFLPFYTRELMVHYQPDQL
jgi:hypothetical protein